MHKVFISSSFAEKRAEIETLLITFAMLFAKIISHFPCILSSARQLVNHVQFSLKHSYSYNVKNKFKYRKWSHLFSAATKVHAIEDWNKHINSQQSPDFISFTFINLFIF